jgi:hypothetical protein
VVTTVIVMASIASFLTVTVDDGYAYVETNEPSAVVVYDARPLPLNELVCLADPAPVDDRAWTPLRRIA